MLFTLSYFVRGLLLYGKLYESFCGLIQLHYFSFIYVTFTQHVLQPGST